jgi:hypothetical protein
MNDHGPNGIWNKANTGRKFVVPKLQAAGNSELLPISTINLQFSMGYYFNGGRVVSVHGAGAIGLDALLPAILAPAFTGEL